MSTKIDISDNFKYINLINRIARSVYDEYIVADTYIIPVDGCIKDLDIFECSFFTILNEPFDFLKYQRVFAPMITKAINDKAFIGEFDNGCILESKNNKYKVSESCSKEDLDRHLKKTVVYESIVKRLLDNEYSYYLKIDESLKEILLEKECIDLEVYSSNDSFNTTMSARLIPAIKQKNVTIEIYGKIFSNMEDTIYEMLIVTTGDKWRFYSRHYVLGI